MDGLKVGTGGTKLDSVGLGVPASGLDYQLSYNSLQPLIGSPGSSSSSSLPCPPVNGERWQSALPVACPTCPTGSSSSSSGCGEGFVVQEGQCPIFFAPECGSSSSGGGPGSSSSSGARTYYRALYGADKFYSAVHDAVAGEFVVRRVTSSGDEVTRLHDFASATPGAFKSRTEPSGIPVETEYSNGKVGNVRRTVTANGRTTVWKMGYGYVSGRTASATLTKQVDGGSEENIRRVVYTYTSQDTLETVTQQEYDASTWKDISKSYYRYYDTGSGVYPLALKYAVGPDAYAEMVRDGLNPLTASDEQVSDYADHYYEYEANPASPFFGEVTKAATRDCASCGGGGGGTPGVTYSRSANPNFPAGSTDYNIWMRKTVRTLANGVVETYYTNFAAQVMFMVMREPAPNQARQWLTYYRYDDNAQVILTAQPSAVTGYNENQNDLAVTLRAHDGLIHV
nr:hypothetical protein [bacterium]